MIKAMDENYMGRCGKIENPVTLEETQSLFRWLKGEPIENIVVKEQPKLTDTQAFSIIYFLQEALGLIPDHYEICNGCGDLYDSECEGIHIDDSTIDENGNHHPVEMYGNYCDYCQI